MKIQLTPEAEQAIRRQAGNRFNSIMAILRECEVKPKRKTKEVKTDD